MSYNQRISRAVQAWRAERGLTIRAAAALLGMSYDSLRAHLYYPRTDWRAPHLERLAAAGVTVPPVLKQDRQEDDQQEQAPGNAQDGRSTQPACSCGR